MHANGRKNAQDSKIRKRDLKRSMVMESISIPVTILNKNEEKE